MDAKSIEETISKMDYEIVYKGFTKAALNDAFNAVANPNDWKDEIFAKMSGEAVTLVVAAIEFFTATTPKVSLDVNTMTYAVYSVGYRMGPAGDH